MDFVQSVLLVFVGGGIGSVCRFFITTAIGARFGNFPFGTLAVNFLGGLFMGIIMGALLILTDQKHLAHNPYRLMLTVGFLGGLTAFSSMSFETLMLYRGGSTFLAVANILINTFLSLGSVVFGLWFVRFVLGRLGF